MTKDNKMKAIFGNNLKHSLEDAYFRDVDDMLAERLRNEAHTDRAHNELTQDRGLNDNKLLGELTELGVTASNLVALRLVPMIFVAWSEKRIDAPERLQIMTEARRIGIVDDSATSVLLEHWLRKPPHPVLLDAWKRYVRWLCGRMSVAEQRKFIDRTREQMALVAAASGGVLGVGKTSGKERRTIDELTDILLKQVHGGAT